VGGLARAGQPDERDHPRRVPQQSLPGFAHRPEGPEPDGCAGIDAPRLRDGAGHLASDGGGRNGLYTENLLRELQVREAKIEDVFKRVRLAVRRASKGAQIPWESTSLEEDFYFLPPEALRKRSQEEEEREFQEESRVYEQAIAAGTVAPLEAYLRQYPSGRFAELAQLRLDKSLAAQGEKPIEPVPSAGNPFTVGTVRTDTHFRVGDSYSYRVLGDPGKDLDPDGFTGIVTAINENEVILNDGRAIIDLLGNTIRTRNGVTFTPRQDQPLEFAVGRRWETQYTRSRDGKVVTRCVEQFRIVAREDRHGACGHVQLLPRRDERDAFSPRRAAPHRCHHHLLVRAADRTPPIARDRTNRTVEKKGHVRTIFSDRIELVSFKQS
jgi:hypothetical protein